MQPSRQRGGAVETLPPLVHTVQMLLAAPLQTTPQRTASPPPSAPAAHAAPCQKLHRSALGHNHHPCSQERRDSQQSEQAPAALQLSSSCMCRVLIAFMQCCSHCTAFDSCILTRWCQLSAAARPGQYKAFVEGLQEAFASKWHR